MADAPTEAAVARAIGDRMMEDRDQYMRREGMIEAAKIAGDMGDEAIANSIRAQAPALKL